MAKVHDFAVFAGYLWATKFMYTPGIFFKHTLLGSSLQGGFSKKIWVTSYAGKVDDFLIELCNCSFSSFENWGKEKVKSPKVVQWTIVSKTNKKIIMAYAKKILKKLLHKSAP